MKAKRLSLVFGAAFLVLGAHLWWMQGWKADWYRSLSERNRIRAYSLEAARGQILDRDGRPLATSRLSFNCSAVPREARPTLADTCRVLGEILERDPGELERHFLRQRPGALNTVLVAEDITPQQAMRIEERLDRLPGIQIETRPQREYPLGEAAAHLVGTLGPITRDELDQMEIQEYRSTDWIGREGVEDQYESYLRGRSGGLQIETDSRGRFVRTLGLREPREGRDIRLTVDSRLQRRVHELLADKKGAVAVMELGEGGLLALASAPSYDPNLFAAASGRRKVGRYLVDKNAPLLNRATQGQYPPGSIFKIVTSLAALAKGAITPSTTIHCRGSISLGGHRFGCWYEPGHGPQALRDALTHSCNVYFYQVGLRAGGEAIAAKAVELGLGRVTGVDLPGERPGLVPSRGWKRLARRESWFEGDTANFAIGQGQLQVTPIQALAMVSAVAAGGQWLKPHVIDRIDGVKVADRGVRHLPIDGAHVRAVSSGMESVINSDRGTGRLSRVEGLRIAGKTGTAQSGQNRTHAWFVGYAPADDPKVAVVVFVEQGGRGGVAAASIARPVFETLKELAYT